MINKSAIMTWDSMSVIKDAKSTGSSLIYKYDTLTRNWEDMIFDGNNNNLKALEYASYARDLYDSKNPKTLKEIIDTSEYRAGGNIVWTSDIDNPKLKNRANINVFDYALRNFNYHQKYKTGKGTVTFYDAKTNKPIIWNDVPLNENGFKSLKPSDVYFID